MATKTENLFLFRDNRDSFDLFGFATTNCVFLRQDNVFLSIFICAKLSAIAMLRTEPKTECDTKIKIY